MNVELTGQILSVTEGEFPARDGREEKKYCAISILSATLTNRGVKWDFVDLFLDPGAASPLMVGKMIKVAVRPVSGAGGKVRLYSVDKPMAQDDHVVDYFLEKQVY